MPELGRLFIGCIGGLLGIMVIGCAILWWLDRTKLKDGTAQAVALILGILAILAMILIREAIG